ncbi:CAF17-like 4Fe-4S cluster assembly/insertion protein YgfZ [Leucobacter chinensis]|uniref:CAF17-like 4Fe-4S cluster assembly/insertion protein YgfZ n=1 Tax=Leucobacter chinensis TaxID=2851010 RepID=UPI001C23A0A2|nr:folate-binding protein [Leucobacter chinensis]
MSALGELPGAVCEGEMGVARHYGQPIAETRLLEEGAALVDLSHRGVVTVTGPDRLNWLDSMTSQLLRGLPPGESTESLLLTAQGRVEQYLRVVDDGETTWLLLDEGRADDTVAFLTRMRFALRVEVADVSAEYAQVATFVPAGSADSTGLARGFVRRTTTPLITWRDPWAEVQRGGHQYAAQRDIDWNFEIALVAREQLTGIAAAAASGAVRVAGLDALSALEIAAWRVGVADTDDRSIPHELDWLRTAVHLNKGCYRGQETVAKVHNLGHPPRRVVMLHIDGSDGETPEPGALLTVAGQERPVGRVSRSAVHHDWGVIALALLKRSTPADATLEVPLPSGGTAVCTQELIVPGDAGATRDIPKLRRL